MTDEKQADQQQAIPEKQSQTVWLALPLLACLWVVVGFVANNATEDNAMLHAVALPQASADSQLRSETQLEVDFMSARVARLQARLMRLEALGTRLASDAKLDKGEFDFAKPVPLGGPSANPGDVAPASVRSTLEDLGGLEHALDFRQIQLSALDELLMDRTVAASAAPSGRPIVEGWLSSHFGQRTDPFHGRKTWHYGLDFAGKDGSEVVAVAAGVVIGSGRRSGYGQLVEIDHGNGYITRYGHNKVNKVKVGDTVERGQVVALMGSSGRSTGPHVHFELLKGGKAIDPRQFIASRK